MNKFVGWILLFFLLLITIPFLLILGLVVPAKIAGVITVLALSFSVRYWLYRTKKEFDPKERIRINLNDRFWMKKEFIFYNEMSPANKKIFEDRIGIILSKVPMCLSSGELIIDRTLALRLAAHLLNGAQDADIFMLQLPAAVILESDSWDERMNLLRNQENVQFVSKDSLGIK